MSGSFVINKGQHSIFERDAQEKFVQSLVEFLRNEVPGAAQEEKEYLVGFTRAMVERAESYGLKTKRDAAVYVTSAYLLGQDFEKHFHIAQKVLTSSLPGPDKADWLQRATVELIDSKGKKASPA